jgi:hypothetical protein
MFQEKLRAPILAIFNAPRTGWAESHMPHLMEKPNANISLIHGLLHTFICDKTGMYMLRTTVIENTLISRLL